MSEECLNAHDKSRVKVLLELSEAKARIEELEGESFVCVECRSKSIQKLVDLDFKDIRNQKDAKIEKLQAYIEELEKALEFYADKDTWTWARNPPKYEVAKSVFDGRERARAALAKRRKETEG
jgi:hypothetical protein